MTATLYYVHDPMCSWCWAFRPFYDALVNDLPKEVHIQRILGGLAADTDVPMPVKMREYVQNHWHTIQQRVPHIEFNFDFWEKCEPRRATYPACRAVIAARNQGNAFDDHMTLKIQHAYYLEARNPSDHDTLISLACELGLDKEQFVYDLNAAETNEILEKEIAFSRQLGVSGFPGLVLKNNNDHWQVPINYLEAEIVLENIKQTFLEGNGELNIKC